MDDILLTVLIAAGSLAVSALILFLALRFIRNRKASAPTPQQPEEQSMILREENAYILKVKDTFAFANNHPVMSLKLALFPPEGPMLILNIARAFSYAELPFLTAGRFARVAYDIDPGAFEGILNAAVVHNFRILGPTLVEWEGDHKIKTAMNALISRIEGSRMLKASGTILQIEKTNAKLNGFPVYRYSVLYRTQEGRNVEEETYEAARPYLERKYKSGQEVSVKYSATDYRDFILERA